MSNTHPLFTPEEKSAAIAEGLAAIVAYEVRLAESDAALAKTREAAAAAEQNVQDCQANLDSAREAVNALRNLLEK